ncbi:putative peptide modification system cyclase [Lysobacter yananisis]|uniref:Peptide modification system cyclase n=1 Tax=Lysobacter yananisis TaxID=1003114 RepID=A0ABY9PD13_9GAMM|nr:putative peptide modification system cyclase [Lysobacter yananisis]WMT04288.1 putative peptide modification system cyclase [Lysobacter yananisis]
MNDAHRPDADGPQLRTLLLTDLCDSTTLVERIGDGPAAELFREHDRLVLALQQRWRGRLIDRSDGLLLLFERPIDGLGFALDYARGLREIGAARKFELKARAGLHVGEVLTWRNSDEAVKVGAKPVEVEGLAKPMAGRLMATARPGQILLSAVAEPLAHRAARELGERGQQLLWKSHGRWRFKGVPEPQEIYEVGEPGIAPLRAPPNGPKAWRDIPLWRRPAALAAEVAVLAMIGTGAWFATRPQPAIAFNQRDWVVVGDLRNLTGQNVLDDSLEQAFRISLEQSRYVNVLSDLKARDTLQRMQRQPDTTLDRAIASEIALRDGARAVILPTVAEVGGRVRVSAEVIDPHTQTTVYAESADGHGKESTLASIDSVTAGLREKLGEAMKSIERDSEPLPKVATKNLDALRAYALGLKAYGERRQAEALRYFDQAIALDPEFALAYLGALRVHVGDADNRRAQPYLEKAVALRSHLAPRDALYLDAWSSEYGPQPALRAPAQWKLLAGLYPDYYAGHYNYAWAAFAANRFGETLSFAKAATAPQNPLRSSAIELMGRAQLAQGDAKAALASFEQGEKVGRYGPNRRRAAALATLRRFDEAQSLLAKLPTDSSTDGLTNNLERIAVAVDRGRWGEAEKAAQRAERDAVAGTPVLANQFALIRLMVDALNGRPPRTQVLATLCRKSAEQAGDEADPLRNEQAFVALSAAYLAQREGDAAVARQLLPVLEPLVKRIGDPLLAQLLTVVQAGQSRLDGKPEEAIRLLRPLLRGDELFQVHSALRAAYAAAGQDEDALAEARWLAQHRGRAYIETGGSQVLQTLNVADTTLALRDQARSLARLGRDAEAQRQEEAFRRAWPQSGSSPPVPPMPLARASAPSSPVSKQ